MAFGALTNIIDSLTGGQSAQKLGDASSFTIEELTGSKRLIKLVGRALPYRPFELTGTQRVTTTWLPGYADATATVLGPTEEPSVLIGYWKDRFIGKEAAPGTAGSLLSGAVGALQSVSSVVSGGGLGPSSTPADSITESGKLVPDVRAASSLMDDVRRQGQLLEVAWDTQVRRGFLKKFGQKWHNAHDMEWEMTFEWVGRAERAPHPDAESASALSALGQLSRVLDDMKAIADEMTAINSGLYDAVNSTLQSLNTQFDTLSQAVSAVADFVSLPSDAARNTVGTLNAIVSECANMALLLDSLPYGGAHPDALPRARAGDVVGIAQALNEGLAVDDGGVGRLTFTQRMAAAGQIKDLQGKAREMESIAIDRRATIALNLQDDLVAQVIARGGDDLRSISLQFYGSPHEWRRLMVFNGLSSPVVPNGALILVPKTSTQDLC